MGGESHYTHRHPETVQGERNGNARLTLANVNEIRSLLEAGWTCTDIAPRFGVHLSTIARIKRDETWRNP